MSDQNNDVTEQKETPSLGGETQTTNDNVVQIKQEALDALIGKRLNVERKKWESRLLGSLGIDSLDALKKTVSEQKQKQEAEKTELQKAQEQLAAYQAQLIDAQAERDGVLIQMAIANEATKQGIPADRINALLRLMDKNTIVIEEGSVKGVDELVKKTINDNPFLTLVAQVETKQTNGTQRTPGTPPTKHQVPTPKRPEIKPEEPLRTKFRL
jgi:hypothetical protein